MGKLYVRLASYIIFRMRRTRIYKPHSDSPSHILTCFLLCCIPNPEATANFFSRDTSARIDSANLRAGSRAFVCGAFAPQIDAKLNTEDSLGELLDDRLTDDEPRMYTTYTRIYNKTLLICEPSKRYMRPYARFHIVLSFAFWCASLGWEPTSISDEPRPRAAARTCVKAEVEEETTLLHLRSKPWVPYTQAPPFASRCIFWWLFFMAMYLSIHSDNVLSITITWCEGICLYFTGLRWSHIFKRSQWTLLMTSDLWYYSLF